MPNTKISSLTASTVPLAGTEVLPIVQSSTTKQVSIQNVLSSVQPTGTANGVVYLNASKVASTTTSLTYDGNSSLILKGTGWNIISMVATAAANSAVSYYAPTGTLTSGNVAFYTGQKFSDQSKYSIWRWDGSSHYTTDFCVHVTGGISIGDATNPGAGNIRLATGNLIQGTAAKGINFTANTPAAGMTSQLLNWYEEGTWTPNQGAGLTLVGAFSSTGRYTRIGRQVSISGTVTGATSVAVTAAGVITSNLPFTVVTAGHGDATNVAINASATVICTGTSVTAAAAIPATATITFSATYFV